MAIETIKTTRTESSKAKKEMASKGWRSVHHWIRHSRTTADQLRKLARAGQIDAKNLSTDGIITWYYHEADVKKISAHA